MSKALKQVDELQQEEQAERHREKMKKAWARNPDTLHQQTVIDTPFEEYVEEFIEYLNNRLNQTNKE